MGWICVFIAVVASINHRLVVKLSVRPRPLDGFNLFPAVLGNLSSPRTEIIHQVVNNYTAKYTAAKDPAVIRSGR